MGWGAWRGNFGWERAWKNPSPSVGEVDVEDGVDVVEGVVIGKRSDFVRDRGRNWSGERERLPKVDDEERRGIQNAPWPGGGPGALPPPRRMEFRIY